MFMGTYLLATTYSLRKTLCLLELVMVKSPTLSLTPIMTDSPSASTMTFRLDMSSNWDLSPSPTTEQHLPWKGIGTMNTVQEESLSPETYRKQLAVTDWVTLRPLPIPQSVDDTTVTIPTLQLTVQDTYCSKRPFQWQRLYLVSNARLVECREDGQYIGTSPRGTLLQATNIPLNSPDNISQPIQDGPWYYISLERAQCETTSSMCQTMNIRVYLDVTTISTLPEPTPPSTSFTTNTPLPTSLAMLLSGGNNPSNAISTLLSSLALNTNIPATRHHTIGLSECNTSLGFVQSDLEKAHPDESPAKPVDTQPTTAPTHNMNGANPVGNIVMAQLTRYVDQRLAQHQEAIMRHIDDAVARIIHALDRGSQ
ncbi:hypothetical protein IWQ61_005948 [Dispira simplex]|nr:hypothetical protein IWQ61_005948 [Dispira simplex]